MDRRKIAVDLDLDNIAAPDHDWHQQGDHQRVSRALHAHCKPKFTAGPLPVRVSLATNAASRCAADPLAHRDACRLKTVHIHHPLLHV